MAYWKPGRKYYVQQLKGKTFSMIVFPYLHEQTVDVVFWFWFKNSTCRQTGSFHLSEMKKKVLFNDTIMVNTFIHVYSQWVPFANVIV